MAGGEEKTLIGIIKEAEVYEKQGLLEEAVSILSNGLKNRVVDETIKESVRRKIHDLEKEIQKYEDFEDEEILSKDVETLMSSWTEDESNEEILETARGFADIGLFENSLEEFSKLIGSDFSLENYTKDLFSLFNGRFSLNNIFDEVNLFLKKNTRDLEKKSQILFFFGKEFERLNEIGLSLEYFNHLKKINPHFPGIKEKIDLYEAGKKYNSKYDYLLEKGLVSSKDLLDARKTSKSDDKSIEFLLSTSKKIDKDEIGKSLSLYFGCPFKSFTRDIDPPVGIIKNLKKNFLLLNMWVPFDWDMERGVDVVINDPRDLMKTDQIASLLKTDKINYHVGIEEDIKGFIELFFNKKIEEDAVFGMESQDLDELVIPEGFELEEEEDDELESFGANESEIVRIVDQLIFSAFKKNASDIHIEPSQGLKTTKIRYRIDGICEQVLNIPNKFAPGIISRLKVMANLDIAEKRLPQDGKIKFRKKGIKEFELRLATLPTAGGFEDAVLRILSGSSVIPIDSMGMNKRNIGLIKDIILKPHGLFLVVGPTGSGKTTTLHSALSMINRPGIKIWTAEDPVEITQEGLRQVECRPKIGLDFPRIMRSFLRADPDVIMIGEMRDNETASIGIEASLTGHLVFSTLHTNSAPETITRLLDMGLNPLNFSDAFLGVLAQRLVRKLCTNCKEEYSPGEADIKTIIELCGGKKIFEEIMGISISDLKNKKIFRSKGCEKCSGGYLGRTGIHELMEGTKDIKLMIKEKASTEALFKRALSQGMKTLAQDGIDKVFQGLTDIDEIKRVTIG